MPWKMPSVPVAIVAAGLDYPGIGPEHANLADTGRASYVPVTDEEAVNAFDYLSRTEGIIPAIESAHAVAHFNKKLFCCFKIGITRCYKRDERLAVLECRFNIFQEQRVSSPQLKAHTQLHIV